MGQDGAQPVLSILDSEERVPWAGHSSAYAVPDIYKVKFTKAGTYPYRCIIHPGMSGVVVVK